MLGNAQMEGRYPGDAVEKQIACQQVERNPTVGENIDTKISILKAEIARLEASKTELAPLMNMRIRDIRDAMSY